MESTSTSSYTDYHRHDIDGTRNNNSANDIVHFLLTEKEHELINENKKDPEDHRDLKINFHSFEKMNTASLIKEPNDSDHKLNKEYTFLPDIETRPDSVMSLSDTDNEETEFGDTVTSYILDEKIRNDILSLNKQIDDNVVRYRRETAEAAAILAQQQNLKRELHAVEQRILNYSVEDAKLKKIQKKKGTSCAFTGCNRKTYFCRFGIPYFKTKDLFPADQNEDMKEIIKNNQLMVVRMPKPRRFLPCDAKTLNNCILEQLKAKRISYLEKNLKQLEKSKNEDPEIEQKKIKLTAAIADANQVTDVKETQRWKIDIDFMALARVNPRFTYEDYERIWNLLGNPSLSRSKFSEKELAELIRLAEENKIQNWDHIAKVLGTNRSGLMCFTKYASSCKRGKNIPWTKEEDDLLRKQCTKLNSMEKSAAYHYWRNIRQQFPNRTYAQIHAHWKYVLQPKLKKGRFSTEEHEKMDKLIKEGKSFKEIASILENRTAPQLRSHYKQCIIREVNKGPWTVQEEELLLQLVEKYGTRNWVAVSKEMVTRSRAQCRLKYCMLREKLTFNIRRPIKTAWLASEVTLFKELLAEYGQDFSKISSIIKTKNTQECKQKYYRMFQRGQNTNKNKLRYGRWSPVENRKFQKLVQIYGNQFTKISEEMQTRDVVQCQLKYEKMQNVKLSFLTTTWSSEEKNLFPKLVEKYNGNFKDISRELQTKSVYQCEKRYRLLKGTEIIENNTEVKDNKCDIKNELICQSGEEVSNLSEDLEKKNYAICEQKCELNSQNLKTSNVTSRWSVKEWKLFNELVEKYGNDISKISSEMKTKTMSQCDRRYRWLREQQLAGKSVSFNLGRWSGRENKQFLNLLKEYGPQFAKISEKLGTKNVLQCQQKYCRMFSKDSHKQNSDGD